MGSRSYFNQHDKQPSSTTSHSQSPVRSRPFAPSIDQEADPAPPSPDLQIQLEAAQELGHSFSRMALASSLQGQPVKEAPTISSQ